jgi:hypothetical protein
MIGPKLPIVNFAVFEKLHEKDSHGYIAVREIFYEENESMFEGTELGWYAGHFYDGKDPVYLAGNDNKVRLFKTLDQLSKAMMHVAGGFVVNF